MNELSLERGCESLDIELTHGRTKVELVCGWGNSPSVKEPLQTAGITLDRRDVEEVVKYLTRNLPKLTNWGTDELDS